VCLKYFKGGSVLSGDLQSVSHVTLKLGHTYLVMRVVYPVSPRLCLPPAVPLATIEITTIDPKGSLPTIPLCEPVFKRFSDKPLGRTDGFVHATTVLSPLACPHDPVRLAHLAKSGRYFKACFPRVLHPQVVNIKPLTLATALPASTSHHSPDTASSSAPFA
jgi:hypothetical protein